MTVLIQEVQEKKDGDSEAREIISSWKKSKTASWRNWIFAKFRKSQRFEYVEMVEALVK